MAIVSRSFAPDFMRSLPRGTFATFVRDLTPTALALKIPYTDLSTLPRMTVAEQQAIRERMRAQFSFSPQKPDTRPPQAPAQPPARAAAKIPKAPPVPAKTDPHTGEHTEPAKKWGS